MAKHRVMLSKPTFLFINEIGLNLTPVSPSGYVPEGASKAVLKRIYGMVRNGLLLDVEGTLVPYISGVFNPKVEEPAKAPVIEEPKVEEVPEVKAEVKPQKKAHKK